MIYKQQIVDFLFWLQYEEQSELLAEWIDTNCSNGFVAQKYIEYLIKEEGGLEE